MTKNLSTTAGSAGVQKMIEVQDLVHVYPTGTRALDGVSFSMGMNEKIAIIGQNGSGKTTLVKHFNGLLSPSGGMVLVKGEDTHKCKTAHLATMVGYVFQNPNHQLFSVSVLEELCFGMHNLRLSPGEIKSRVDETVNMFHLEPYLNAHPYSLSLGVRKLVAIASVYAMGPQLMILDEPTTGQDYRSKQILSQAIYEVHQSGRSIVFVSHDMDFVAEHADRAVVMSRAKIIFDGQLRDLFVRKDVLTEARLRPPQITELGQCLPDLGIRPDALSIPEMIEEIRRCAP
jgi:energy-coupling factor transporter ATP-binding protein EcfA2